MDVRTQTLVATLVATRTDDRGQDWLTFQPLGTVDAAWRLEVPAVAVEGVPVALGQTVALEHRLNDEAAGVCRGYQAVHAHAVL